MTILWIILALLVGVVVGFFGAQQLFKKQMRDNPPINEEVIRTMMSQMGRKPSQKQVNVVMQQIKGNMK